MGELDRKVAIITGAGRLRGIGRATALAMARLGANVVITGTGRDPETYPDDEKAAVALEFAAKITKDRGNVSNDDVQKVRSAGYSDAELVEIIGNVALNVLTNYINRVLATDIDFPSVKPLSE